MIYLKNRLCILMIPAMFIFYFCKKLQDNHGREYYDYYYDRENQDTMSLLFILLGIYNTRLADIKKNRCQQSRVMID